MAKQENFNMSQGREELITKIKNKTVAKINDQMEIIDARNIWRMTNIICKYTTFFV